MADDEIDFYQSLPVLNDFAAAVRAENIGRCPTTGRSASPTSSAPPRRSPRDATRRSTWSARASSPPCPTPSNAGPFRSSSAATARASPSPGRTRPRRPRPSRRMAAFSRAEFDIDLRVAMVPVREIRAAGRDVRVARYGASPHASYAMFAGGGLAWLEERVKRGDYALAADPEARPDLSGLSCRWSVSPAKRGDRALGDRGAAGRRSALRRAAREVVGMALKPRPAAGR